MTSGRRAVLVLIAGTLILFLVMMVTLLPSLRPYRRAGRLGTPLPASPGAPASGTPTAPPADAPGGIGAVSGIPPTPADSLSRAIPKLAVSRSEDSTGESQAPVLLSPGPETAGRVDIEPAPFQPTPPPASSPEAEPPPPPGETPPMAAPAGAGEEAESGASSETSSPAILEPPVVLKAAWLSYPEAARKRKAEGSVEVRIHVSDSGGVLDVALATSAGDTVLDRAALEAARTLKFRPARLGTSNVAVWYNYRFVFTVPR